MYFERKSKYNPDREHYISSDGKSYCYKKYDTQLEQEVNIRINLNKCTKKSTIDIASILDKLDHESDLNERYSRKSPDGCITFESTDFSEFNNSFDIADSEFIRGASSERLKSRWPKLSKIYDFVEKNCNEKEKEIFYRHLLLNESLEAIRKDEINITGINITQQAFSKRKKKLINKLRNFLEEPSI